MRNVAIIGAALLAITAGGAKASHLSEVEGSVFVNHGDGFRSAGDGADVGPGDRIKAAEGSAYIVYENGCAIRVGPKQVTSVLFSPPTCGGGLKDGAAVAYVDPLPFGGLYADTDPYVGLIVFAGGIATAVVLINNNMPASP